MEIITGKQSCSLGAGELARLAAQYDQVLIDLGTGDGKYVLHQARSEPRLLAVGVDACRENLRAGSRAAPENALFVIANALALPAELDGLAHRITVNFPWGSLLEALLEGNEALLGGLLRAARPGAAVEIRLNLSAVRAAQETAGLDWAGKLVCRALAGAGLQVSAPRMLDSAGLRALPSTWARKMASGRRPTAVEIIGKVCLGGDVNQQARPLQGSVYNKQKRGCQCPLTSHCACSLARTKTPPRSPLSC